uniref:Uncharacterized protein n=1 Tax=Oryza rufipogon TaxID=4529 RepID=A0A0E0MSB4_ORYRU
MLNAMDGQDQYKQVQTAQY